MAELGDLKNDLAAINDGIDGNLGQIDDHLKDQEENKALDNELQELAEFLGEEMQNFEEIEGQIPETLIWMIKSCEEMLKDSQPDNTADYWEEKDKIAKWLDDLKKAQKALNELQPVYESKDAQIKEIMHGLKGADKEKVAGIVDKLKKIKEEVQGVMEKVYDARDTVNDTQKEMGDCFIPVNIQHRRKEITSL